MALTKITTSVVAVNSLTAANIADNSIDATKIANNQILARHIAAGALSDQLAANSITAAMIPNASALTLDGGVTIDNITIDGTEIDLSSGDLTVDVAGTIILDADAGVVDFKDGGTHIGRFENASSDFKMESRVQDKDIVLVGNDSGTGVEALRLDMSEAGKAIFNAGATFASGVTVSANGLTVSAGGAIISSGDVGIGTTSPDALFEVERAGSHNSSDSIARITGQTYPSLEFYSRDANASNRNWKLSSVYNSYGTFEFLRSSAANGVPNQTVMSMNKDGKVGIGTASPSTMLTVVAADGVSDNNYLVSMTNSEATASRNYGVAIQAGTNGTDVAFQVSDYNASNNLMRLYGSGRVQFPSAYEFGVGTDNPSSYGGASYEFHKSDSAQVGVRVSGSAKATEYGTDAAGGYIQVVTAGGGFRIYVANSSAADIQALTIGSTGHVTKTSQPYIRCAGNSASMATSQGSSTDFSNWADQVQTGITRSGAVFTVPTAGNYMITYSFYNWMNNTGKGVTHGIFLKKGSTTIQETNNEFDMGDNNYAYYDNNINNSIILNMAAGDTFKFTSYADVYAGTTHTNMSAYLLG